MTNRVSGARHRAAVRPLFLTSVALAALPFPAFAQNATELPEIAIDASPQNAGVGDTIEGEALLRDSLSTSDTAEIVTQVPGVDAYGAGGVASLPTIRGLENRRITILLDGIAIDEVCPNVMNSPLSYTDPQTIGSIAVLTGVTPVSMGGDTIGGAILVQTADPRFAATDSSLLTGNVSGFYRSNGDAFGGSGSVTVANDSLSLTYNGSYTESGRFEGGGDDGIVRSSEYAKTDHALTLGIRTASGLFTVRGGYQFSPYEGFPNQYMDMTENESWFANARYQGVFDWGDVDATVHYRETDHEMNFLEDKGGIANGGMPMLGEGRTAGYRMALGLLAGDAHTIRIGSELHHQWLNEWWPPVRGNMMMGPETFININAAHRNRLGLFLEWEADWGDGLQTTVGVRNDQVWMNTGDVAPYGTGMMQMADVAAAAAFNAADRDRHDSNWSGSALARWEASDGVALELGYAHKVRSPSLYERYTWGRGAMASRMIGWFGDGNGYVGNLDLEPESADTISAALELSDGNRLPWTLRISPYYTHVDDYIDVVQLQNFTDMMGNPTGFVQLRFVNSEARFYGIDVDGVATLWSGTSGYLRADLSASWLHGENLADDEPLYHQMPFNLSLGLRYFGGDFDGGFEVQAVADKSRVDPTRNEPETRSYALVDVDIGHTWSGFRLGLEVTNLLDTSYDAPLGGQSLGDRKATGILRPLPGRGRSVNVSLSRSF